jgi:hypothetical protein
MQLDMGFAGMAGSAARAKVREADWRRQLARAFVYASGHGALVVTRIAQAIVHRELIIAQAARHRLPAVYHFALLRR